VFFFDALIF